MIGDTGSATPGRSSVTADEGPPPPPPTPPTAGRRWWVLALPIVAAGVIAVVLANPPEVEGDLPVRTARGRGVVVDLPEGWRAAIDPVTLLPPIGVSAEEAQVLEDYFRALAEDEQLAIVAYEGFRTLLVERVRVGTPGPPLERVVRGYLRNSEDTGFELVEEGEARVDGHDAARLVFRRSDTIEETLDFVWVDGPTVFITSFSTSRDDFDDAEATFDRIAATIVANDARG